MTEYPFLLTSSSTPARKFSLLNFLSGKRILCTKVSLALFASSPEAAIHPACLPITSKTKTLVEVLHIDLISKEASFAEVATYFATEPKPGQLSVTARSLSIVLGIAIALSS